MSVCKCQRNKVNLYDFGFFQNQYVLSGYELSEANLIIVIPNRSFRYLSPIRLEFEISFRASDWRRMEGGWGQWCSQCAWESSWWQRIQTWSSGVAFSLLMRFPPCQPLFMMRRTLVERLREEECFSSYTFAEKRSELSNQ